MIKDRIVEALWKGQDPFVGFPGSTFAPDMQGWNSDHRYLTSAIQERRPTLVVEVGVWKGGSVMKMAEAMKNASVDGAIIAVDTWLGSHEHFLSEWRSSVGYVLGYPTLYHTFMANVKARGLEEYIVPLPLDSVNALEVLSRLRLSPDLLHIDAGHDRRSVESDLTAWWPFLNSNGALIGDDYWADGHAWPDVRDGFDAFFEINKPVSFEAEGGKCLVVKS